MRPCLGRSPGAFGNVGRIYLSGPNLSDLDASLAKSIRLTQRFNGICDWNLGVTNTPQFFLPQTVALRPDHARRQSFGHVTSATGGRTLQIGAKLNF